MTENKRLEKTEPLRYSVSPECGLSSDEAEARIREGFANSAVKAPTKTVGQIIASNLLTYYNLIFAVIAIALLSQRAYTHLTFLPVIIANILIGTVQELKSKHTLDKLTLLHSPKSVVIRDSKQICIPVTEIVLDDVILLRGGNQIPADAVMLDGNISVNESLVTGESDEITKKAGDVLLSGSFVVSGEGRARIEKVGADSFAAKLTLEAGKTKKKQQPGMMRSLTLLIKIIGVLIIPFAVILFINQTHELGLSTRQGIENTSAAILGMIPEGLYLLTSVALAVSVIKLAKKRTLVHELKCIETLARADVLCVDKTGTITENEMTLKRIADISGGHAGIEEIRTAMSEFVFNMSDDNNTIHALKREFSKSDVKCRKAYKVLGFNSAVKYSAVSFGENESYIIGAPEFVMGKEYENIRQSVEKYSGNGERVLLFAAYNPPDKVSDIFEGAVLNGGVKPLALIVLANKVRKEAKETFRYFETQGVKIKVISGDNPKTVSAAAGEAGISDCENYVDATLLDSYEKIKDAADKYCIFGRVTPSQKRQLIRAFKSAGHTVAMTGDGVNDVLALKDADCSIAMASGSEAACQVSDLVLLDSDFSSMPAVVAEGRRVINNIERSASLFLVKNIFSFGMSLAAIFIAFVYPFKPSQLTLVNALMIGIPSFVLALEPNTELVKGKFLRNVLYRAFPAAVTDLLLIGCTMLFGYAFDINNEEISTICVLLFGIVGLIMLFRVCKPFDTLRKVLWISMGVLFVSAVCFVSEFFSLTRLSFGGVLVFMVLGLLSVPVMSVSVKILEAANMLYNKIKLKFRKIKSAK